MMRNIRIIPRLDIKGPNLVKGVHLEGLRVLGKPEDYAFKYYTQGADELLYIDVVASLYGRNSLLEIVRKTAENIFIPLTVGGGVRTIDDIRNLLRAGADKVAINTAAIKNPNLIKEAAETFGSQCIVVSIEAKRKENGKYEAYADNGREKTGVDVFEWARRVVDLKAGEILVTSIDREGTSKGFDIELTAKISQSVPIPVIACGGAGCKEHFIEVIRDGKADAVCSASIFHYDRLLDLDLDSKFKEEGNVEFLKRDRSSRKFLNDRINPASIPEIKSYLTKNNIFCRTVHRQEEHTKA